MIHSPGSPTTQPNTVDTWFWPDPARHSSTTVVSSTAPVSHPVPRCKRYSSSMSHVLSYPHFFLTRSTCTDFVSRSPRSRWFGPVVQREEKRKRKQIGGKPAPPDRQRTTWREYSRRSLRQASVMLLVSGELADGHFARRERSSFWNYGAVDSRCTGPVWILGIYNPLPRSPPPAFSHPPIHLSSHSPILYYSTTHFLFHTQSSVHHAVFPRHPRLRHGRRGRGLAHLRARQTRHSPETGFPMCTSSTIPRSCCEQLANGE